MFEIIVMEDCLVSHLVVRSSNDTKCTWDGSVDIAGSGLVCPALHIMLYPWQHILLHLVDHTDNDHVLPTLLVSCFVICLVVSNIHVPCY